MVRNVSPLRKMSLRKKIKPPKPFTGDVVDDLSSSIQGDRIIDSSEMEETTARSLSRDSETLSPAPTSTCENTELTTVTKKRGPAKAPNRHPKKPRLVKEESDGPIQRRSPSLPKTWRPGLGMTPANNKKYLGPQTEFNPNLPPAAFPTYTSDQYLDNAKNNRDCIPESGSCRGPLHKSSDIEIPANLDVIPEGSGNGNQKAGLAQVNDIHPAPYKQAQKILPKPLSASQRSRASNLWAKLSLSQRFVVVDAIVAAYNDEAVSNRALSQLPITGVQYEAMDKDLMDRKSREQAENQAHKEFTQSTTKLLMTNDGSLSETGFRSMLQNLYKEVERDDDDQSTTVEDDENLRAFVRLAGYNPSIVDESDDDDPLPSSCQQEPITSNKVQSSGLLPEPKTDRAQEQTNNATKPLNSSPFLRPPLPAHISASLRKHDLPPIYQPSKAEHRQNQRVVSAALNADPVLRAGTSLTGGGGGMRHMAAVNLGTRSPPAGDLSFDGWRQMMNSHYEDGDKMLEEGERLDDVLDDDILGDLGSEWRP